MIEEEAVSETLYIISILNYNIVIKVKARAFYNYEEFFTLKTETVRALSGAILATMEPEVLLLELIVA
jgi:hypothetical protein